MDCIWFNLEKCSDHALGGVSGVASFFTIDEQLQKTRLLLFLVQAMLPGGFTVNQFKLSRALNCSFFSNCAIKRKTLFI